MAVGFDPPWRLDPLKNIVNVGWGGVMICALEFDFQWNGDRPAFPLEAFNFTNLTFDMFDANVRERATGVTLAAPSVVNPISDQMIQRLIIWNKGPKLTGPTVDFVTTGRALWFFNLSKIAGQILELQRPFAKFTIRIPKSNGTHLQGSGVRYFVFPTFLEWFPPDGGPHSVFIVGVFTTAAEAQALADTLNVHSSYRVIAETGTPVEVPDTLTWNMRATLYRGKKDFPVDADNKPTWPFTPGIVKDGQVRNGSGSHPARSLIITINTKTLRIASELT